MHYLARLIVVPALLTTVEFASGADQARQSREPSALEVVQQAENRVREKPNDPESWHNYDKSAKDVYVEYTRTDLEAAIQFATRMEQFVNENMPEEDAARKLAEWLHFQSQFYRWRACAKKTTRDDLKKRLLESPNDFDLICIYEIKVQLDLKPLINNRPHTVLEQLPIEESFLKELREISTVESVIGLIDETGGVLDAMELWANRAIERLSLVCKKAPPLADVASWINGDPKTAADLEGNVVLLDFWAVYCPPCIAAFPDLRAWHTKYVDEGLIIIGVTDYNNFVWDEETESVKRSEGKVRTEDENEMLHAFAQKHEIPFPIVVQSEGAIASAFQLTTIPQVVLIDRQGHVRMIRVGHDESITQELGEMIETLIAE